MKEVAASLEGPKQAAGIHLKISSIYVKSNMQCASSEGTQELPDSTCPADIAPQRIMQSEEAALFSKDLP